MEAFQLFYTLATIGGANLLKFGHSGGYRVLVPQHSVLLICISLKADDINQTPSPQSLVCLASFVAD
jgi:hypothetical protein